MLSHKPKKMSKRAQRELEERNALIARAKAGDEEAIAQCQKAYGIKVYSVQEIDSIVKERPQLKTKKVIGKSWWDTRQVNNLLR